MDIRNFFKAANPQAAKKRAASNSSPDDEKPAAAAASPAKNVAQKIPENKTKKLKANALAPKATPLSPKTTPLSPKTTPGISLGGPGSSSVPSASSPPPTTTTPSPKKRKRKNSSTPKAKTPKEQRQEALGALAGAMERVLPKDESDLKFSVRPPTSDFNPYNQQGGADEAPPQRGKKAPPPESREDLFLGLTFVITGTLDSLLREECEDVIKRHGGRVTGSVSGKTDFLVVGTECGQSKVKAARERRDSGCRMIDEDGLFALIGAFSRPKEDLKTPAPSQAPAPAPAPAPGRGPSESQAGPSRPGAPPAPVSPQGSSSSSSGDLWVTKHKPSCSREVVGNPGHVALMNFWLRHWREIHVLKRRPGLGSSVSGSLRGKKGEEVYTKKALVLSGPPGVGKTTCATLLAREAGYAPIIEVNASDTRGKSDSDAKKGIGGKRSNQIRELVGNTALGTKGADNGASRGPIVIMDECDGMSGSDRGGIGEVVDCIKRAKIPMICICNDKYNPKMKPLRNVCIEVDFRKPTKQMIAKRMAEVCKKEGLVANAVALETLAERANGDLRVVLGHLQQWRLTRTTLTYDDVRGASLEKDSDVSPFKVCDLLLGREGREVSLADQVNLVFQDIDLIPLLIQENYVNHRPAACGSEAHRMKFLAKAADGMSQGDWASQVVRGQGEWGLMPFQAVMSSVYPATYMRGQRETFNLYPNEMNMARFSAWLGKNSSQNKNQRELLAIGLGRDALPLARQRLSAPLIAKGKEGIDDVIGFMTEYNLVKEDRDAIFEMRMNKKDFDPLKKVPTAVKSALTRQMTKDAKVRDWEPPKPKAKPKAAKGKKKQAKAPAKKRQKK